MDENIKKKTEKPQSLLDLENYEKNVGVIGIASSVSQIFSGFDNVSELRRQTCKFDDDDDDDKKRVEILFIVTIHSHHNIIKLVDQKLFSI